MPSKKAHTMTAAQVREELQFQINANTSLRAKVIECKRDNANLSDNLRQITSVANELRRDLEGTTKNLHEQNVRVYELGHELGNVKSDLEKYESELQLARVCLLDKDRRLNDYSERHREDGKLLNDNWTQISEQQDEIANLQVTVIHLARRLAGAI